MTKSLTDMDLSDDKLYYWRLSNGEELIQNKLYITAYKLVHPEEKIEYLAPVPSYKMCKAFDDELKEIATKNDTICINNEDLKDHCNALIGLVKSLDKKLEIATKALKEYMTFCRHPAEEALKEIKEVK